jgi:septum site-determining protein MinD
MNQEDLSSTCPSREQKTQLLKEVLDEALGLGPLEDLLADESVTEIMVNARDQIYIERGGKPQVARTTFTSEEQMMKIAETRMDFETMVGLYQKSLGLLRLASRAPGR